MRIRILAAAVLVLVATTGCARLQGQSRTSNTKATKDCAACARMCEVAGESKGGAGGVDACKADCEKTCEG